MCFWDNSGSSKPSELASAMIRLGLDANDLSTANTVGSWGWLYLTADKNLG